MTQEPKPMFAPHKIERAKFKVIHDQVIVHDMTFDERVTTGGIVLLNDNGKSNGIRPRWGRVYAVGSKQQDVQVGQWVLVAHGRWTRGLDIEDENGRQTVRKIDPNDILLVADGDTAPSDTTFSDAVYVPNKSLD